MIERVYVDYLSGRLSVPVYAERPAEDIPERFVLIDNTGTSKTNKVWSSRLAFQSFAGSLFDAAQLNDELMAAVEDSVELDAIASAKLNSAYNFTDTASKMYRYQAVFDIYHY